MPGTQWGVRSTEITVLLEMETLLTGDTDHILVASVLGDGIAASYRRISDGGGGGWGVELDSEREPGFSSEFMLMAFLISCDILITDSINIL